MPQPKFEVQVLDRVDVKGMEELLTDRFNQGWELTAMVPHFTYQFYVLVLSRKTVIRNGEPTLMRPGWNSFEDSKPLTWPETLEEILDCPPRVAVRDAGWEESPVA